MQNVNYVKSHEVPKFLEFVKLGCRGDEASAAECFGQVRLWNTDTGHCAHTYKHQQNQVSSCAWQPDSRRFVVGTVDRCDTHSFPNPP